MFDNLRGVLTMKVKIVRFIERDYRRKLLLTSNESMTEDQADALLDQMPSRFMDVTFTFYGNGTLTIVDNHTELRVPLKELQGAVYDFYVRQRIQMIRENLEEKILQSAS
jgi:hypothetical protein